MSLDPNGAPPGYYYEAGATAYIMDPSGTYSTGGATAPTIDPAGTYSAAGASAPTLAAAGTYILNTAASQYGLNRLFLDLGNKVPLNEVLSFNSVTAVENYFGVGSAEATLATDFFAGYDGSSANMLFVRTPLGGARARIYGANISRLTLPQLRAISGPLDLRSGHYEFRALVNLSTATSFASAASLIQSALNAVRPTVATTTNSSITPESASFVGSMSGGLMDVTAVLSGQIAIGGILRGDNGAHIIYQESGTPGGAGVYNVNTDAGTFAPGTALSETYGILTIGDVTSGTVAVGQEVTGNGIIGDTAIESKISGSGSTWVVDLKNSVTAQALTMKAAPLTVTAQAVRGATVNSESFWIEANGSYPFLATSMTSVSGRAATLLGLTQSTGAYLSTPGQITTSLPAAMNNVIENENSQWSSFQQIQSTLSVGTSALSAWSAASGGQFQYLSGYTDTTPPIVPSSAAAEIVDPAGTYSGPGASAPTIDPAGSYSLAGASAPTLAQPGYYVPTAGASSETPDDPGYYTPYAGATAEILALPPTISGTVPGQTTPSGQPDTPFASVMIAEPNIDTSDILSIQLSGGGTLSDGADFSGLTTSAPGVYALSGAAGAITSELDALVFTPGSGSGTTTFTLTDTTSVGKSASDANTTVTVLPADQVAQQSALDQTAGTASDEISGAPTLDIGSIVSPPGTYLPAGASAPTADPGGTYSGAGASAPTEDPAGTYSSPYALDRLFLVGDTATPDGSILSFNSAAAVAAYYGAKSGGAEAQLASDFFAGYGDTSATIMFIRYNPTGERPHLNGANVSDLSLSQLQSINGSLAITLQGWKYSGEVNLSRATSFPSAAHAIQAALNSNLQVVAVTAGSSIASETVSFTGSTDLDSLIVTSISSGSIELGAEISLPGISGRDQVLVQLTGTPGGAGVYTMAFAHGIIPSETMTESYGVLTVGSVTAGAVGVGEEVTGPGVLPSTGIDSNLSGSGAGSTWVVNYAQTVAGENMTMTAPPLHVLGNPVVGATGNNRFTVQPDRNFGFDDNPSSLSYASGTAAAALGLTQASGAVDTTPGGQPPPAAAFLNNLVQNENAQFGSFQGYFSKDPEFQSEMAAWAESNPGFTYLGGPFNPTTTPAGSSLPTPDPAGTWSAPGATAPTMAAAGTYISITGATSITAQQQDPAGTSSLAGASAPTTDPAGTWSAAGASAPTLAAAGTYIPGAGATSITAEVTDLAGSYSLAGASAPTYAQVGYYVSEPGASSETPDGPGYYTPNPGATAEILALTPTITGTVAGQSVASGQTDTPFSSVISSVMIADPNTDTLDSLSIQITGGGGKLSDGAGFDGLTESASGVYTLSGTAAAITSELDALVFTPNTFYAKTTFTLVDTTLFDTTSLATSQPDSNTTVTVTKGEPVVASVSQYLADPSKYDGTQGGFDILGTAAAITASLDPLDDPNIDAITISGNGVVSADVQQLMDDAAEVPKLQNANLSPVLLAINDTFGDIEAGLSMLVADAGEIGTITASNGPVVVLAATFLSGQSALGKIVGGFSISDTAADLTADLDQLNDPNISAITISDSGQISVSAAQLTNDATAIGKLQNADDLPVLLAVHGTAEHIEDGLSTLVADAAEIASIKASDGPVVVSAAAALSDQSTLDLVVGGVNVSDSAANLVANLAALNADSTVTAITDYVGDATLSGGVVVNAPSFSEAFGANLTVGEDLPYAGTFTQDSGSETAMNAGDTLSLTGISSLSGETDGAGTLALPGGSARIESGATVTTALWLVSGAGTDVTLDENLTYAGSFSESVGSTLSISSADLLSLTGTANLSGTTSGAGTLALAGGNATIDGDARIKTSDWSISGSDASVTLDQAVVYDGGFIEDAGDTLVLSGGYLLLSGPASFAGGTAEGSKYLYTEGTTTVSGLTIGGTVEWENTNAVNQSGGNVTLGDNVAADEAILRNDSTATYDILNDSGIGLGASTASHINNDGLFEKTGGTGTSVIAPTVTNTGTIEVAAAMLDLQGAVTGTGSDNISVASTLEFDSTVALGQTVSFAGSGGTLDLTAPQGFAGLIGGFDTAGAGSNDAIEVAGPWVFTGFTENAGGTQGTLGFANGASTASLTLLGDYNSANFVHQTGPGGSTLITYT